MAAGKDRMEPTTNPAAGDAWRPSPERRGLIVPDTHILSVLWWVTANDTLRLAATRMAIPAHPAAPGASEISSRISAPAGWMPVGRPRRQVTMPFGHDHR